MSPIPHLPRRVLLLLVLLSSSTFRPLLPQVPVAPVRYERQAVVCESRAAAEVGARILEEGGNAVDAAVATALAMAVTFPQAGNIGGGGFLVAHFPGAESGKRLRTFDFREQAPGRAHAKMFLDEQGEYSARRHHHSHLAVGVPGSVAGLALAHRELGKLPWRRLLEDAIQLARDGFEMPPGVARALERVLPEIRPASARECFLIDGKPIEPGQVWKQPQLARTLERLASEGPREFYEGETAELLVTEMERGGGWITAADLAAYEAVEREPVIGEYRGHRIVSMPPPSSGGVALVQMLNILEHDDLAALGYGSAAAIHLQAEAMRRAFADRARLLGDPDQVDVPVERLTGEAHASELRRSISTTRASQSSPDSFRWPFESDETTHISIVDGDGNAVSLTTTLEHSFGARIVVPRAGFLLNNEMGDFNAAPGLTRRNGLIGTEPNLAAPRKRMISSMTPTIVLNANGKLHSVLGSPGGRTIINSVLQVVVNLIDHDMGMQAAVDAPRVHHQWLPDVLWLERGISPDTAALLRELGHEVRYRQGAQGSVMAIRRLETSGELEIGRDRRRAGTASAGR